jgi:hypothetical protein
VDGTAYAVCDNSWAISRFGDDLTPFSAENKQIGNPIQGEEVGFFGALAIPMYCAKLTPALSCLLSGLWL